MQPFHRSMCALTILVLLLFVFLGGSRVTAQSEIGYIEQFALAEDRREPLTELIPGTDDFYYFHCLHQQNEKQLAQAAATLEAWRARHPQSGWLGQMTLRQALLDFDNNPQPALDAIRKELHLQINHQSPRRDRAAALPTVLDNAQLQATQLIEEAISRDRSLSQLEDSGLWTLTQRRLPADQLRVLLERLERSDLPGTVERIAEELALKDSKGFGWAKVHRLLTQTQLDALLAKQPQLLEQENFVLEYATRLAPQEGASLSEGRVLAEYLRRLRTFAASLPPSKNSFKAIVLGNTLKLNMSRGEYDRELFLEYLALPRTAAYYLRKIEPGQVLVDLNYAPSSQLALSRIGDDSGLIRRYLEQFLQADDNVDAFASFLERKYLENVFAETKILYGIGDSAEWYRKLTPAQQQAIRQRVEVRFAPDNSVNYKPEDDVSLDVEFKNVSQVVVKIYQISLRNYYRGTSSPIGTNIDLDGLVPNGERQIEYSLPADRRHRESIALPELEGRGVWVVDLLGAGIRSRTLVQKGGLIALEEMGDAGQEFTIIDESGERVPSAYIELGATAYRPDSHGKIRLPFAQQEVSRNLMLIDGDFATQQLIRHASETYELTASFVVDRQSLVAGNKAAITLGTRLSCNGQPVRASLLEQAKLTITATDADGISTSQSTSDLGLTDSQELTHVFLVPPRLMKLELVLSGVVKSARSGQPITLQASQDIECNGMSRTELILDSYLMQQPGSYRLFVLGRNGEPAVKQPIQVSVKMAQLKTPVEVQLATNQAGIIELGQLTDVVSLNVRGEGMQATDYLLDRHQPRWPLAIQIGQGAKIQLPLSAATGDKSQLVLQEVRRNRAFADQSQHVTLEPGGIVINNLPPGDFELRDWSTDSTVRIRVAEGQQVANFVVAASRILETRPSRPVVIRSVIAGADALRIEVDGADEATRVHVLASAFKPTSNLGLGLEMPTAGLSMRANRPPNSSYVDSLRLDEEYGYILDRRTGKKYPGNMLPQPSLLIHPWEISTTENLSREARAGDMPPAAPEPEAAADSRGRRKQSALAEMSALGKSYDFLAKPGVSFTNLELTDGLASIPLEALQGYSYLTIYAVHPTSSDVRELPLELEELAVRDNRLRNAYPRDQQLAQTQRVEILSAGQVLDLGDSQSKRLQTFGTLGGVFQLYATLLGNSEWEKFRFVTRWNALSKAEKLNHYSELACHELNLFLFHKDREFFDLVIKPFIAQKMDKQFIDHWLLEEPLDGYLELSRFTRLNTLERVLLASRVEPARTAANRWLADYLAAHPINPAERKSRFDIALLGTALDADQDAYSISDLLEVEGIEMSASGVMGGGSNMNLQLRSEFSDASKRYSGQAIESARGAIRARGGREFFGSGRQGLKEQQAGLFEGLEKTRQWAETHYYKTRIAAQLPSLIPANAFWQEYLVHAEGAFLPTHIDLPCSNIHEALCALAVIDLPFESEGIDFQVHENQLSVTAKQPTILLLEALDECQQPEADAKLPPLLVGQELYLASPGTTNRSADPNRPVNADGLIKGLAYKARVVVTNPTNTPRRVNVLTQLPAGSLPLAGGQVTRSTAAQLSAYGTQQIEYSFYFPVAGEFEHYGVQVSSDRIHLAATNSTPLVVLDEPLEADESSWAYVADWGTGEQVTEFLATHNLQQIDLSRIAFRMADPAFYATTLEQLTTLGSYEPSLWAYAVKHADRDRLGQLLRQNPDFLNKLGPAFDSPLLTTGAAAQMRYEHLDYRPLVVARAHTLGSKPMILNDSLAAQYDAFLDILAYQAEVTDSQRMQLCYYMLVQNRIEQALHWFESVDREQLETQLQYDYFDAHLDFYRGEYQRASEIAGRYADYPIASWQAAFNEISSQVATRNRLLAGREAGAGQGDHDDSEQPASDALRRDAANARRAAQAAALSVKSGQQSLLLTYRNLEEVQINYYLMDIELLFSRRPFVTQTGDRPPAIAPNASVTIPLPQDQQELSVAIPDALKNRNLIVEVTGQGVSQSTVLTASEIQADVIEAYGQIRVRDRARMAPTTGAYVKVYARHADGSVKFYKDGYTDLRGFFDYASLSTGDLNTTSRFAILVLHDELGALVYEAAPPTR